MKTLLLFLWISICTMVGQPLGTMYDPALLKSSRFGITTRGCNQHSLGSTDMQANAGLSGNLTVISSDNLSERARFGGVMRQFSARPSASVSNFKAKIFRYNGSTFDNLIDSAAFTLTDANASNRVTLSSGISVREGDILGYYIPAGSPYITVTANVSTVGLRYGTGDLTGNNITFPSSLGNYSNDIEGFVDDPVFLFGGDSIMAGHNAGANWLTWVETGGPSGTIDSSIPYQISLLLKRTAGYANNSHGSYSWSDVVSTTLPIMQTNASAWVFHCGVNDVSGARSWANVLADLNTVKAALPTGTRLYIDEILPWTNGSDAQALTVRTWNANYAEWCAANGATLIPCHDAMGQIRLSTGQLDDLLTAYDQDGVHVTMAGVLKMAQILYQVLARDFGI